MGEHGVHESIVSETSVLEAEVQDVLVVVVVVVVSMIFHECHLGSIQRIHSNLVVLAVGVHEDPSIMLSISSEG